MNKEFQAEPVSLTTPNLTAERLDQLCELFPEAFTEGKVDFDKLRAVLGDFVDDRPERYSFTWAGKRDAIRLLQTPSTATLVPAPEESINWDTTQHVFIEGENLEVLKLLYKAYFGKVKLIYIDPPYNTGSDFVYPDDYSDPLGRYLEITGQKDTEGNLSSSNPETSGRYHSAWLNMMYPRLVLARQLLVDDGAICVSIGEEELHNLRAILNEVFGEENYRNTIIIRRYDKNLSRQFMDRGLTSLAVGAEYVVVYAKSELFSMNPVFREASAERQKYGYWKGFWNSADRPTMRYELLGVTPDSGQWKWERTTAYEAADNYSEYLDNHAHKMSLEKYWEITGKSKRFIRRNSGGQGRNEGVEHWIPPSDGILRTSNWTDVLASTTISKLGLEFNNPKNPEMLKQVIKLCTDEEGLIVDFFAGSCSTADAVFALNAEEDSRRQVVLVQLPEAIALGDFSTIADVGKERMRRSLEKYSNASLKISNEGFQGFRAFRLSESSLQKWKGPSGLMVPEFFEQLDLLADPMIEGWHTLNVVWEVAIREGFPLTSKVIEVPAGNQSVYRIENPVTDQSLHICLDKTISAELPIELGLLPGDLFICRDVALDDTAAANIALNCRLKII